nr:hypothetical protein [Tanacetum cinerariifolium]
IPFAHFINNDLEYLWGGASSKKYKTSVTKTKAADYEHIKWIEDLVPRTIWIQEPINYDKHALWGVSHWDVYKEYRHPAACGRSSTRSRKLLEEAQPYQARHVPIRSKATRSIYCLFKPKRIYLSKQGQEKQDAVFATNNLKKGDKDKAAAMIQAINKMLKTRRIMRSLESFVGGRLYERLPDAAKDHMIHRILLLSLQRSTLYKLIL